MGPRSLHLVDGSPTTLNLAQLPSPPPTSSTSAKPNVRRHSSISYRSSNELPRSPLPNLRPDSPSSSHIAPPTEKGNQSGHERLPLTLVEKHSDLLHFIAQKESKCLELRSQLSILEAEIIQLKRKWERIVNRGFLDNSPASPSTSQGNGAVIEGIVEGVQGVGRFLAGGLTIGEQKPSSSTLPVPRSLHPLHSRSQSSSSSSSYTNRPSHLPQTSASSTTKDTALGPNGNEKAGSSEPTRILMVHDTGATPTMSPNPAFVHQRQRQKTNSQSGLEVPLLNASKLFRRKSTDVHSRVRVPFGGLPTSSSPTPEATQVANKEALRPKRTTLHGANFPPVSSIPGLAALTVSPTSPVPSWVESIGKKWEGLHGSTFSKNQKRASTLLSDVSQSIVSALSSPSTLMSTPSSPIPSYFDLAEPQSQFNRIPGPLLDNDSNVFASQRTMVVSSTMVREKPCSNSILEPHLPTSSPTLIPVDKKTKSGANDEDGWNW